MSNHRSSESNFTKTISQKQKEEAFAEQHDEREPQNAKKLSFNNIRYQKYLSKFSSTINSQWKPSRVSTEQGHKTATDS